MPKAKRYNTAHITEDARYNMLQRTKERAKKRGIVFDLVLENLVIPEVCPVLGIPLKAGAKETGGCLPTTPTIDRIKPELGYTPGNIRVISHRANMLRSNATLQELRLILDDAERLNRQD